MAQPNAIHAALSLVDSTLDLQVAFKSVPQPATASLRGLLATSGSSCHSFAFDAANSMWFAHGDGTVAALGEDWESVVSKCSLGRLKPVLLIYQIHASNY